MDHEIDHNEGDINLGDHRTTWQAQHIDAATSELMDDDTRWFLHQSMSTPCLNALEGEQETRLTYTAGRRILGFMATDCTRLVTATRPCWAQCARLSTPCRLAAPLHQPTCSGTGAAALLGCADGWCTALFAPGVTLAMGMTLKLARPATRRFKTISMWDAFHGESLNAIESPASRQILNLGNRF